jgi:hypothetical protein
MVGNFAIGEYISKQATDVLDPQGFEDLMTSIVSKGEQFGADWSSSIIAGIANNNDFDFSSIFGDITQSEFDYISKTLTGDDIADLFGINWSDIGFSSAEDFKAAFLEGFEGWDPEANINAVNEEYNGIAEGYDIDVEEFKVYRDLLA